MNWVHLDQEAKLVLKEILPKDWVSLFKVTSVGSYYDMACKADGIMKLPYTWSIPMLYDLKTNASYPDKMTFTIFDKSFTSWFEKPHSDMYIFILKEVKTAWFVTYETLCHFLTYKKRAVYNRITGKYKGQAKYVWVTKNDLYSIASIVLQDGVFTLPSEESVNTGITVEDAWRSIQYAASRNNNPMKADVKDLNLIYKNLQSLELVM